MESEIIFEFAGEGGSINIRRSHTNSGDKFSYHHNEFDPTNEGLDINKSVEYDNFDTPFQLINDRYRWYRFSHVIVHSDFRNIVIKKLIEGFTNKSVSPKEIENDIERIEYHLKIRLKCFIDEKNKTFTWSFNKLTINDQLSSDKEMSDEKIARIIAENIFINGKPLRIKVRTLLKFFNYGRRTEESATRITELLAERDILLNPSIMKIGDDWQLKLDDRISLSINTKKIKEDKRGSIKLEIYNYQFDKWFDEVLIENFRTEKEVENKFIIPLLERLNYNKNDRFDGMIVHAAHGSKQTILEVDFALFNSANKNLDKQTLLVVEAKKEERLSKKVELDKAQRQAKSYGIWLGCHFGLVTDGKLIQVIDLFPCIGGMKVIFECKIEELRDKFSELYELVSKNSLTAYYERLIN